jgi:hypothetical protein
MTALILSVMMCGSPDTDGPPRLSPGVEQRIAVLNIIVELSEANFRTTLFDSLRGKRLRGNLIKRGIDLAVAYESRFEYWLAGSTKLLHASAGILANR